jgi:hypothetical protein
MTRAAIRSGSQVVQHCKQTAARTTSESENEGTSLARIVAEASDDRSR